MKKALLITISAAAVIACAIGCQGMFGKNEINIGAILPLTGDAAKYGESAQRGINLAVQKINTAGGIDGKIIKMIYEDDQATPEKAVTAFQKLISIDKVKVVIGAMPSSGTLAIAPIAEKNKIVLFSPASSAPQITNAGDYIFRNDVSDIFEGGKMAEEAIKTLKLTKAAVLYINNDYGVGIKDVFVNKYKLLGGEILAAESFEQSATDFKTQLTKIKKTKPQALYLVGHKEQIQILKQFKEMRLKTQILATTMFEDPEILDKTGSIAEGAIYTYRAFNLNNKSKEVKEFVNDFKNVYNIEPDNWAAQCYDALNIVVTAIKYGGTSSDGIKAALYSIKDYPGVTGTTSFDKNGDVIKPIILKTVNNGIFITSQ